LQAVLNRVLLRPAHLIAGLLAAALVTQPAPEPQRVEGGIVRGSLDTKRLALVFTGHEFAEGATPILDALASRKQQASFFLTGVFLRNPNYEAIVQRMVRDGHYVGPHSDAHLLYCPWTGPKTTLVSREEFVTDLERNLEALTRFGIDRRQVGYFLPPYEWYNEEIVRWSRDLGLTLVNFTPGTRSNADYTEEATPQFVPSASIFDSIIRREAQDTHGLNGFLLLLHIGSGPGRADKFHPRVGDLIDRLMEKGYRLVRVDELLGKR
jgi:peptidoglycan/xylan/chitin deacetylase (PgdA/CDA1 family)